MRAPAASSVCRYEAGPFETAVFFDSAARLRARMPLKDLPVAVALVDFELVGRSIRSQPVRCRSQLPSATGVRQYRAVTLALYVTKDRICGRRRRRNCNFGGLRRRCDAPADGRQPQILTQLLPFQWAGIPLVTVATAAQQDRLSRQKCMRCDRHCQREQRFDAAFGACNGHHHLWLTHRYFQYTTECYIMSTPAPMHIGLVAKAA